MVDRAPYQREIMDCISDTEIEEVILIMASQTGKTEIFNNAIGYYIHQDPSPIMMVQPTKEMGESWSKIRFVPMVRDTPVLKTLVNIDSKRDGDNTILEKSFPGGNLTIVGANAPSALASRPKRIMVLDEVDRYPASAKKEGRPSQLAIKRTTTFWNKKILKSSSPTIKGESEIEEDYDTSDKRRYWVQCPECGEKQLMVWEQLKWPENEPENAYYVCGPNGCILNDGHKYFMLKHGEWRAEAPFRGRAGFHISSLYSPWVRFGELAKKWVDSQKDPEKHKVFINTEMAETYEENIQAGDGVEPDSLLNRVEDYDNAPAGVLIVTMSVDVQDDRLEYEIAGWGEDEECWSIRYGIIHGDPGTKDVWRDLDDIIESKVHHASGLELPIMAVCIDAGGHYADDVYAYVKAKQRRQRRVYWVRGHSATWKPLVSKPVKNDPKRGKGFYIGTDTAKDTVFARLKVEEVGPAYCHFPAHYEDEYFKGLTSEVKVKKMSKGRTVKKYEVRKGVTRNEPLDLRVYNLAAIRIINPKWDKWKLRLAKLAEKNPPPDSPKPPHNAPKETARPASKRQRRGGNFVNRWRD